MVSWAAVVVEHPGRACACAQGHGKRVVVPERAPGRDQRSALARVGFAAKGEGIAGVGDFGLRVLLSDRMEPPLARYLLPGVQLLLLLVAHEAVTELDVALLLIVCGFDTPSRKDDANRSLAVRRVERSDEQTTVSIDAKSSLPSLDEQVDLARAGQLSQSRAHARDQSRLASLAHRALRALAGDDEAVVILRAARGEDDIQRGRGLCLSRAKRQAHVVTGAGTLGR